MREPNYSDPNDRLRGPSLPSLPVPFAETVIEAAPTGPSIDIPGMIRRYWLLAVLLMMSGVGAGFVTVILSPPTYQARALVEVQRASSAVLRTEAGPSNSEDSQVELQTQIHMMRSSAFLRQVMQRVQMENISSEPLRDDLFSKLRRRTDVNAVDPAAVMKTGLDTAIRTFDVRPVNGTRILELTCDSTHPEIAATFINALANEYIQQNMQAKMKAAQSMTDLLSQKLEETKTKMLEAESHLNDFVRASGNLFVTQENTLADTRVRDLQSQLASVQAQRINKKAMYDLVHNTPRESLPDVLNDSTLHSYQSQIADLRRQKATLNVDVIGGPKVQRLDIQIQALEASLQKEIDATINRTTTEYQTLQRTEEHLSSAYAAAAGQVGSQSGKAAEYGALKREAESLRQIYNTLLLQANEAFINGSVIPSNIILVDSAVPPPVPYKPRPAINLGFGGIAGFALCVGIAFIREKFDQRVSSPLHARQLLNLPQLGVIPSVEEPKIGGWKLLPVLKKRPSNGTATDPLSAELKEVTVGLEGENPSPQRSLLAESFRVVLASVMREPGGANQPRVILVTSPGPEEGKTTIASNLSRALAETGRRVLVFDADFRRPRAHKVFGLSNTRGLVDLLAEDTPIANYPLEALGLRTSVPNLYILPNGRRSDNIAKTLYSVRLRELVQRLKQEFDTVLIDAPPLLAVADARVMCDMTDGVVLVLRSGVTDRQSAVETLNQLRADGVLVLGTILNDWTPPKSQVKRNYYYSSIDSYDRS